MPVADGLQEDLPLVVVVDDEEENVSFVTRALRAHCRVLPATSGAEAVKLLETHPDIEAVITDQRMPEVTGTDVLRAACDNVPNAARIVITGYTDFENILDAINEGRVHHVLVKPLGAPVLQQTVRQCLEAAALKRERDELLEALKVKHAALEKSTAELEDLARKRSIDLRQVERTQALLDALTGLFNHRYFHDRLATEIKRALRHDRALSVMFADLNELAAVNREYGFADGDKAIVAVADLLRSGLRDSDVVARYNGHCFAAILPETDKDGAIGLGKRVSKAASALVVMTDDGQYIEAISMMVGVATLTVDANDHDGLVDAGIRGVREA